MEYIINGTVKYNSADGTLFCPDSSVDMITLTRVTSELLLLLIQNKGMPLSRDSILSELWEKRGLSASSNNLNNYVSMLRKALVQCGCPDLITTIPRHGFLFEAEIVAVVENDSLLRSLEPVEDTPLPLLLSPGAEKNSAHTRHFFSSGRNKVMVSVLVLLMIVFLPGIYSYFRLQSVRTEFFTFEQCRFYLADDKTREIANNKIISNLKAIVPEIKLNCGRRANVYYFADKKEDALGHVVMTDLVSYCPYKSKAPCDNYYLTRHENENEK